MKISINIGPHAKIVGEKKAVEYVAKAGFDAWDLSMLNIYRYDEKSDSALASESPFVQPGYLKFVRELKKIGEDSGIYCNQSHAPFPVRLKGMDYFLKRTIECTAEAGGKICVIHPNNNKSAEENAQMYFELLPFAKNYGVKIATENMWNWDNEKDIAAPAACSDEVDFKAHLDAVNDDFFVACLDIGHAEMMGLGTTAEKMIYALGDKLQALHIHDNDKKHDNHQIPLSMDIDFKKVVYALKKVGYRGDFTLETDGYFENCAAQDVLNRLIELKNSARKLADMFEKIE